jgi:hypothetical protein
MADMSGEMTPLFAPTQRPDEPLTAGAPFGDGPGPAPQQASTPLAIKLERMSASGNTDITELLSIAQRLGL